MAYTNKPLLLPKLCHWGRLKHCIAVDGITLSKRTPLPASDVAGFKLLACQGLLGLKHIVWF